MARLRRCFTVTSHPGLLESTALPSLYPSDTQKVDVLALLHRKLSKMYVKSIFQRSKNGQKLSFCRPKSTFPGRFRLPQSKYIICVFTLRTLKKSIFWPSCTENRPVCPEGTLKSLKNGQKHVCRPSNDVDRLYFAGSSVWNSNVRSKSPSQSSVKVEKTEKLLK